MKTLFKKSISLFLTVLMIMSCWVWVAPEQAEAANIDTTDVYKVTVYWNLADRKGTYTGGNIKYKTVSNYGYGSESSEKTALSSLGSYLTNNKDYSYSFDVPKTDGFPTVVKISYEGGNTGWGGLTQDKNKARCTLTKITINGKQVWKGEYGYNGANSAEVYATNGEWGTEGNNGTFTWPRPHIAGFLDSSATADDINLDLNEIGGANVEGSTGYDYKKYTCYDQYGVQVPSSLALCNVKSTTTYVSGTENSDDATSNTDIWSKGDNESTVIASPNLQVSDPKGSTGSTAYYLVRKYVLDDCFGGEPTSKVSAKINVTYPKYTVNFNAGLSNAKITADKEYTGTYRPSNYHGGKITLPSKAEASGYTFYGFWSKQQPTSGNASYNAATADFAKPCPTDDYNAYVAAGGKVLDGIVTDSEGNKWYDAGVELTSEANTINVEDNYANHKENWYGWWLSKDLSVKFYDVDGTFLGEKPVKSGQTQKDITWPTSKYINSGYTTGAFKFKVDANIWENTDGREINKNSYTFTEDLILTPKLTRESFTDKYTVTFINPNNGNSVTVGTEGGNYDYRQNILDRANEAQGKIAETPSDVDGDLDYSYELLGWSSVVPTTGKNYHVLLEDADFDVNGTSIGLNNDWVVRNKATYYAVYRRHTKTYVVNFNYKDATGADATRQLKVKYGAKLVPPTEYVPYTYVTKGFGYTFDKWSYTTDNGDATLAYTATIPFTSENIQIAGAALEGSADLEPIVITATYGEPVATPYTVTFKYVNDKGEEFTRPVEVRNEQFILSDTVDSLTPAEKWDYEDNLYTYANQWEITEGSATVGIGGTEKKVGDIINTADLTSLTPTSNITFKAVYADPVPFYTVTYIDGANSFTDRVLQGSEVPEWTYKANNDNGTPDDTSDDFEEDKIYTPKDYEGEGGTYVFQGWYDQKQTDTEYKQTNGNKITTADKVNGNLTLYPQFKFVPFKYTIKFMNYDGSVQLGAGEYEKGQNIEALVTTATKAAQGRAADDTYTYLFLGWDKAVPTFCEGYDVTYTALYKPVYRYYDVKWYNSKLVDGEWVADKSISEVDGKETEIYLLATTHHTYNSKLYTPAVDNLTCLETAPEGQNYVFAGWYYNDAEGNAVKYERGMLITAEMEFYATYTLTAKTYTVTTVVRGETETYPVADGNAAVIPDPQAGWKDATTHDAFAGWYTDEDCTVAFDADTAITADTTIYAKFTVSAHDYSESSVESVPTYYAKGSMKKWCACDQAKTTTTEEIPMLTDTKIPTGTIYLGALGQWSSTDAIGGAALDKNDDGTAKEITLYANADTDVIITANDTGDVNALYNPSGIGKGVQLIRAFIYPGKFETLTSESYGAAQQLTVDVYVDGTQDLTNNANFSVKLGDFVVADLDESGNPQYDENNKVKYKDLESGESYIVYYYVVDKAGNQLRQKVRTAKFIYDNTAPVFTVEGTSNEAKIPTYCGKATVTDLEKDVVLTVNGEVVTATYAEGAETGTYTINYAEGMDNVIITATDKAGNTFSKKIKVADHSYIVSEQSATCGVAGYKKEECIICGDIKTNETYDALDHIYSIREVIPADCENIGSIVVTCEICGDKVTTQYEEDGVTPVIPKLGHEYELDENNEIIYKTVTASTCKTAGLAEAFCTACGEGRITKELALDATNHEDVTTTEVKADCVNNGYKTVACSCGTTLEHYDHINAPEVYAAKGHGTLEAGTAEWYVTKEPTCYQEGEQVLKCLVCTNFVEKDGKEVTEPIPATGEHVKTVSNPDTYKTEGVVKYHCATAGCPYKYENKILENETLEEFTVKFYAEDGKTLIKEFTKTKGEYIAKTDVTAPEKDETAEFKYSFKAWVDKATGKTTYKLPLEVTGNLELKASYKETAVLYTHQFVVPNVYAEGNFDKENVTVYKTLLGKLGEERVVSGVPVFNPEGNTNYTYEFMYWANIKGEKITDFTITTDTTFYAKFNPTVIEIPVIFYNDLEYVWAASVDSGSKVTYNNVDDEGNIINPTKNYDKENHYTFAGWYANPNPVVGTDDPFDFNTAITAKTRLYAGFTATKHTLVKLTDSENELVKKYAKAATCEEAGAVVYACECGYYEVEATEVLGHVWSTVETEKDGVPGYACTREGCDAFNPKDVATYTVTFKNGSATLAQYTVVEGNKVDLKGATFNPTKAETAEYKYTFTGKWICGESEYTIDDILDLAIEKNYTFEADYTATKQVYTVSYLDVDHKALVTAQVEYGKTLYAYTGATPTKEYDNTYHYTFKEWDKDTTYEITGNTYVMPVFTAEKHNYNIPDNTEATCVKPGQTINKCSCGDQQVVVTNTPALGHTDIDAAGNKVAHTIVNPTITTTGSDSFKCQRCGETITKTLDKLPSTQLIITVKDAEGNLAVNGIATVVLKYKSTGEFYAQTNTNENGQAIFTVPAGEEWIVGITGRTLPDGGYGGVIGKGETSFEASPETDKEVDDNNCSCSCHKKTFWGWIFRLFQKLIAVFRGGEIRCCTNPSELY